MLLIYDDNSGAHGRHLSEEELRDGLGRVDRHREDRPWLMTNMVHSVDGATVADGRSGGLAGEADRRLFHLIRELADTILVGAATVRAERYHPTVQQLVVVSRSLDLPADLPFLTDPPLGPPPIIATTEDAADETVEALGPRTTIWRVGRDQVDLGELIGRLGGAGCRRILCEGGPVLLGQLARDVGVDEWFVTTGGQLVGGATVGLAGGLALTATPLRLHRLLIDGDDLYAHYLSPGV